MRCQRNNDYDWQPEFALWHSKDDGRATSFLFSTRRRVTWEGNNNPTASTVTCLLAYPGGLLVGTAAGAYRRSGGDWAALPGGVVNVSALTVSGDGHAWVGTADQGVFEEREGGLKAVPNSPRQVTALLWTGRGLMVGSDQGAFLDGKPLYDWHGEISGNHITALACSTSGVWAGTFQDGLSQLPDGQVWRLIEGLPSSWINQLSSCGDQVLVRFSSGLIMSGQKARSGWLWQTMGRSCGWPKDWTSGQGQGWVATLSGFYAQQKRGWKTFTPKPALQGVTVTGVARFRQPFWLASQNGVYRLAPVSGGCNNIWPSCPTVG